MCVCVPGGANDALRHARFDVYVVDQVDPSTRFSGRTDDVVSWSWIESCDLALTVRASALHNDDTTPIGSEEQYHYNNY